MGAHDAGRHDAGLCRSTRCRSTTCRSRSRPVLLHPKKFEGVGESSEGRTRSAKTVRRTTETGSSPVSTPLGHRSSYEQHPGASNLSLADALRLRLEPASSPLIAYDPRFDVAGSMRSRRHASEPDRLRGGGGVTSSSCASWSCAPSSLPLTWSST